MGLRDLDPSTRATALAQDAAAEERGLTSGARANGDARESQEREVMGVRQAAEYLGCSADTVYQLIYRDEIPAFRLGARWKFKKSVLDNWMEKRSREEKK